MKQVERSLFGLQPARWMFEMRTSLRQAKARTTNFHAPSYPL
jgi:hypothetical protein